MKLVFEKGSAGRGLNLIRGCDVPRVSRDGEHTRETPPVCPICRKMKSAAITHSWQSAPMA